MKRKITILLAFVLLLALFGCSEKTDTSAIITFPDHYLEEGIRLALNKPKGNITENDALSVTVLDLSNVDWDAMNAKNGGIKDLTGIEHFTNLVELHLDMNDIKDFTPLSQLIKLEVLTFNGVRVEDLSVLSNLTNMVFLGFNWSYAPDFGFEGYENLDFIKNMKNLEILSADNAGIKDISAIIELPKLWSLYIRNNLITDISPLSKVKTIKEFLIGNNPISDYSCLEPLKEVFPNISDFVPDVPLN